MATTMTHATDVRNAFWRTFFVEGKPRRLCGKSFRVWYDGHWDGSHWQDGTTLWLRSGEGWVICRESGTWPWC